MGVLRNLLQGSIWGGVSARRRQAEALYQRALAARQGGDRGMALESAVRALDLYRESAAIHYLVGTCHFEAGQYESAAGSFTQAARFAESHPLVLLSDVYAALSECRCGRGCADLTPAPAHGPVGMVSIIICSIDDGRYASVSEDYRRSFAGIPHEIIRIDDARSLAEGYNRGIDRAGGDFLLFSHDDIRIVTRDFGARCLAHLQSCELLGIAGSAVLAGSSWINAGWPHTAGQVGGDIIGGDAHERGTIAVSVFGSGPELVGGMRALDGVVLFVRRALAQELRFDQETFDGWHLYDIDFSFRAVLAGHQLAVANDLLVVHASQGRFGPEWEGYARRFMKKFDGELPAPGTFPQPERCVVTLRSDEEWRALAATRLARHAAWPCNR